MAKSTKKTAAKQASPTEMTSAMAAVTPIAATAWMKMMSESTQFVMDRLQSDLETQKALLQCKTPTELLKLQTEFYQTAVQDYTREAARLFEMMTSATTSSMKEAQSSHKRGYDDIPL